MELGIFYDHLRAAAAQESLPISEVCLLASAMGYRYVDIDGGEYMRDWRSVDATLGAADMRVGCVDGRFDLAHESGMVEAEALIRFAADRGVGNVLLIPGSVLPGEEREAVMERVSLALRPLARLGKQLGVCCSLEDYDAADAPYGTARELQWYMERVDGLGCTFDTGNFAYFGEDALTAFAALKPFTVMLHLKDRAARSLRGEEGSVAADGETMLYPCAVGEGGMPVEPIVRAMAGRDIGMTAEHFGANRMLEVMRLSAQNVRRWAEW